MARGPAGSDAFGKSERLIIRLRSKHSGQALRTSAVWAGILIPAAGFGRSCRMGLCSRRIRGGEDVFPGLQSWRRRSNSPGFSIHVAFMVLVSILKKGI